MDLSTEDGRGPAAGTAREGAPARVAWSGGGVLVAATGLLLLQLAGEVAVQAFSLPIPGPVAGMLLLYAMLSVRGSAPRSLARTANGLLSQLSLLFVPAGVGIMAHLVLLRQEWLAIASTLIASTTLTLLVTGLTMRWLMGWAPVHARDEGE
jgi:holin-like protein